MSAELVPVSADSLSVLAPQSREAAVTQYLTGARDWLARAVEITGPEQIAAVKAEIATTAEATRQLGLSKEIQLDAQEMVRRAEYALGKAIRKGQDEGAIRTTADSKSVAGQISRKQRHQVTMLDTPTPTVFASHSELYGGASGTGVYAMVDGTSDEQFEDALTEAKAESNLSRANVVRKITEQKPSRDDRSMDRLERITAMADEGFTSRQIAKELGHTPEYIRQLARDYDIPIPADKITRGTRHIDSNRVMQQIVLDVAAATAGLDLVEFPALDRDQIQEWANSLSDSLRALSKFANRLKKELTQP